MIFFLVGALLLTTASAVCDVQCGGCLSCVAFNSTTGPCAACNACYEMGCSLETTDFTDGFGLLLKGAACESNALKFYGDIGCKSEAVVAHTIACYEVPLQAQAEICVGPAYVAEIADCVANTTKRQVEVCLAKSIIDDVSESAAASILDAYETCQDLALFTQETTCNHVGLKAQTVECKANATLADKKAGILQYATLFSGVVMKAQVYSCANGGKTFSPTVRTTTPTTTTKVPTTRTKVPTIKTASPVITKTPTIKTKTPTTKTTAPTKSTGAPTKRTKSPTGTPTTKTSIPVSRSPTSAAPTTKTKAPTVRTTAPSKTPTSKAPVTAAPVTTAPVTTAPVTTAPVTTAPVTTGPTTTGGSAAPTGTPVTAAPATAAPTGNPTIKTKIPTGSTGSPVSRTPTGSPTTRTKVPTMKTSAPTVSTKTPTTRTKAPTGTPTTTTKTPTVRTSAPTGTPTTRTRIPVTKSPVSAAPTTKTKVPTTKTSAPSVRTAAPTTKTKVPTTKTSAPTARTAAPTIKSASPTTTTKVPTTMTKIPTVRTTAPITKTPTVTTSAPTSSPTSACEGSAATCASAFTALFDWNSGLKTTAQVTSLLNASKCLNNSISALEPFYQAVYGCYLSPTTCGAGANTTNKGPQAVFTKNIMTTADACSLDSTLSVCSTFAVLFQGTCATIDASCKTCLDARTYSKTNTCMCNAKTLAAAVVCNATKISCDKNVDASNTDCTNATVVADAACEATASVCAIKVIAGLQAEAVVAFGDDSSSDSSSSSDDEDFEKFLMAMNGRRLLQSSYNLTGCDPIAAAEIAMAYTGAVACAANPNPTTCFGKTNASVATVTACYEHGPSCAAALFNSLLNATTTARTTNCTEASLKAGDKCMELANECVSDDVDYCRLTSSAATVVKCDGLLASCFMTKTVAGGCDNVTVPALVKCDTSADAFIAQLFDEKAPFSFGDNVTAMTAANAAGQKALGKNSACMLKLATCHELIDSNYANTDIATACDGIGINMLTGQPYLEDTDYPTWQDWVDDVCVGDAVRTPAPTSAPVVIAKVSKKTVFTATEELTVCSVMNGVAFRDGVIGVLGSLKCAVIEEQVASGRRLLNATTTTLYSITGSISSIQAKVAMEVLAKIGVDAFAAAVSTVIKQVDPKLGAAATVSVKALATNAPTMRPTMMPTRMPTVNASTIDGVFSVSSRVAPGTLIAAASLLFLLL